MTTISKRPSFGCPRSPLATSIARLVLPVVLGVACLLATGRAAFAQSASFDRLQPIVNDAVAQLQLSYRHDRAELEARYAKIGEAINTWNKSSRDAADGERLAEWLRAAMLVSMPGSREPLPPLPEFGHRAGPLPSPPAKNAADPTNSATDHSAPAASEETPRAEEHVDAPVSNETPESAVAPEHVEAVHADENSRPSNTVEAHQPITVDEGDPFQDDPLPSDDALFGNP